MRYRLVVQHLLRPIPPLLIGVLAGIGGTFMGLGWGTRWYALRLVEPTPPVSPEAWVQLGALILQAGAVFLLPVLVVGGIWLWDVLALLRRSAVVSGRAR